jgi:hypothetical protein
MIFGIHFDLLYFWGAVNIAVNEESGYPHISSDLD